MEILHKQMKKVFRELKLTVEIYDEDLEEIKRRCRCNICLIEQINKIQKSIQNVLQSKNKNHEMVH